MEIAFAHRTFAWGSDARGKAHVHVVIIGLTHRDSEPKEKRLFSYDDINGEPDETRHGALTAYLFGAENVANRRPEERRVGKRCVSTCRFRWAPYHTKKTNDTQNRK